MVTWIFLYIVSLFFSFGANQVEQENHSDSQLVKSSGLFSSDSILHITLEGDIHGLMRDRFDDATRHPLQLHYPDSNEIITLNIEVKTRGHFRRTSAGCTYPPLMLYFKKNDSTAASIFKGQSKLKLVVPCRSEELILKEWLAYKMYNLLTPQSFRVRLLSLTFKHPNKNKSDDPLYAFLLEDEDDMAVRNNSFSVKRNNLPPTATDSLAFFRMAFFQYLIGNTDWSTQYMQNIKLLVTDTISYQRPVAVPYDFDMSGWVNAPYAKPAPELLLSTVKTRRFRGYCITNTTVYNQTLEEFIILKPEIYQLLENTSQLSARSIAAQKEFLDGFYSTIANRKRLDRDLLYPCDKNGTGNVVIRGLNID